MNGAAYMFNGISLLAAGNKNRRPLKSDHEYPDWTNIRAQVLEGLE